MFEILGGAFIGWQIGKWLGNLSADKEIVADYQEEMGIYEELIEAVRGCNLKRFEKKISEDLKELKELQENDSMDNSDVLRLNIYRKLIQEI